MAKAEKLGIKYGTLYQRLVKFKGNKELALTPLHQGKRNQLPNLSKKVYSTRIPCEIESAVKKAIALAGTTESDWIATAILEKLNREKNNQKKIQS